MLPFFEKSMAMWLAIPADPPLPMNISLFPAAVVSSASRDGAFVSLGLGLISLPERVGAPGAGDRILQDRKNNSQLDYPEICPSPPVSRRVLG